MTYVLFDRFGLVFFVFFFFFQAEDGIRDVAVTGVQTCALPISSRPAPSASRATCARSRPWPARAPERRSTSPRSEERRVGKECRSRWRACNDKKKCKRAEYRDESPVAGTR